MYRDTAWLLDKIILNDGKSFLNNWFFYPLTILFHLHFLAVCFQTKLCIGTSVSILQSGHAAGQATCPQCLFCLSLSGLCYIKFTIKLNNVLFFSLFCRCWSSFLYFTAQILPGPVPPEVKYRIPSGNKQEVFTLFRVKINWLEADQLAVFK